MEYHKKLVSAFAMLLMLVSANGAKLSSNDNADRAQITRELADIAVGGFSYKEALQRSVSRLPSDENCKQLLEPELIEEIAGYQKVADEIIDLIVRGTFKGTAFKELTDLVDLYPIRPSGHQSLEDSIDYMMDRMEHFGLKNIRGEQVLVPHWVRGEEKAELLEPHRKNIKILGLGMSVGTPEEGLAGEVIVVKSFADLDDRKDEVAGKIVVYNQGWLGTYGDTVKYRDEGASYAAQYGAIAALIQSVAPFSMDSPHTGVQTYWSRLPHIPVACITMEDADFLYRLQQKGNRIRIQLTMLDYNLPMTTSRNAIGEIGGKTKPEEYVAVSGHIDSWDVGQGAMDDAGGVMISLVALAALKHLGREPSRTLQVILWTSEEVGLFGVEDFAKQHNDILANYSAVFESDFGTFKPIGLDFAGTEKAGCIVNEVLQLTERINTTKYRRFESVSSDITRLIQEGVPGIDLNNENEKYFFYHHTEADTITMIDSDELDLDTALWAVASYVLSDISEKLPRVSAPPSL